MNKVIKLLMMADVFVVTGFGLIEPILAIYIKENLVGGTIFGAGLASSIFLITKSAVQLPASKYVDKKKKKTGLLVIGTILMTIIPIIYIFANHINWIYLAQFIFGIGSGLAYPSWLGVWSKNLDKGKESYEWSLYSTFVGIGTALTGAIGATIADQLGFKTTFVLVYLLSLVGLLILFHLNKEERAGKFD